MPRHYFSSKHYSFSITDDPKGRVWRQGRWFLYVAERQQKVRTIQGACDAFRDSVLRSRRRYGGEQCAQNPWPETPVERVERIAALRRQNKAREVEDTGVRPL